MSHFAVQQKSTQHNPRYFNLKKKGKTKLNLKESERSRRKEIKDLKINEIEFRQQRKSTKPKAGSLNIARREHTFS